MSALGDLMHKKVGPVPVPVIGIVVVGVGWYLFKKNKSGSGTAAAPGGAITSPDSGTFTGTNTVNGGDGSSATQTTSGPLLSGGFVGNPLGYPGGQIPGGDVYINVPGQPPPQTTTNTTSAQTYTVATGDTLQKIAAKLFGDGSLWHQLYAANASVVGSDPSKLAAGMVLTVPTIPPGSVGSTSDSKPKQKPSWMSDWVWNLDWTKGPDQQRSKQHSGGRR